MITKLKTRLNTLLEQVKQTEHQLVNEKFTKAKKDYENKYFITVLEKHVIYFVYVYKVERDIESLNKEHFRQNVKLKFKQIQIRPHQNCPVVSTMISGEEWLDEFSIIKEITKEQFQEIENETINVARNTFNKFKNI